MRPPLLDALTHLPVIPLLTQSAPELLVPGTRNLPIIASDGTVAPHYAGNKARKHEYLLAAAARSGARTVATMGAWGSNHCLATAIHARRLGFDVVVHHFPQPPTHHVRDNLIALAATGALLRPHPTPVLAQLALAAEHVRPATYVIPGGGSAPIAVAGYVRALHALIATWPATLPPPDRLVVAAGTCGTLAGLALGLAQSAWSPTTRLTGVRVTNRVVANDPIMRRLVRQFCDEVGVARPKVPSWEMTGAWYPPGYGFARPSWPNVRQRALAISGLVIEPTYTGRAFEAALHHADAGERVLYWHTLNQHPVVDDAMRSNASASDFPPAYAPVFDLRDPAPPDGGRDNTPSSTE